MKYSAVSALSCTILLFFTAIGILQPVMADNGTISIAYRGSGGGYVGDTIVFDGKNTYGNITMISIIGPGLPAEGVPAANLNGPAGTGTPVRVDPDGTWKYTWYSSSIPGNENLQTWRYLFIAADAVQPEKSATASFMLKKPEYRITASPNPVHPGGYVELTGIAERGGDSAMIAVSDSSGNVMHTFTSPVSASGSFSYSFHADMDPGQYTVTVHSPALRNPFGGVLIVAPEGNITPVAIPPVAPSRVSPFPEPDPSGTGAPGTPAPGSTVQSPVVLFTSLGALAAGFLINALSRQ